MVRIRLNVAYLDDHRSKLQAALIVALMSFLILYLLQPFKVVRHGFTVLGTIRTINYALVGGLIFYLAEVFIQPLYQAIIKTHNTIVVTSWYTLQLLIGGTIVFVVKNAWLDFNYLNWSEFLVTLSRSFAIGIFPLLVLFLLMSFRGGSRNKVALSSQSNSDSLLLETERLVLLKSEDNYTTVFYRTENGVKKKLLRGSLTSFEKQLSYPLFRCHRSFIVNLEAVESSEGNSQGYSLTLADVPMKVTVSRKHLPQFRKLWDVRTGDS